MSHLPKYKWNRKNVEEHTFIPSKMKVQMPLLPQLEDILRKDLLKDCDVLKLQPDYEPPDPSILMNMRRLSVRPRLYQENYKVSRQKRKRNKDTSIVNREVMRLKNELKIKSIQNKITMHYGRSIHVKLMNQKGCINDVFIEEIDNENVVNLEKIQLNEVRDENNVVQIQAMQPIERKIQNEIASPRNCKPESGESALIHDDTKYINCETITKINKNTFPSSALDDDHNKMDIIEDSQSNIIEEPIVEKSLILVRPILNVCSEKVLVYRTDSQKIDANEIRNSQFQCEKLITNLDQRQKYLKAKYYDKWRTSISKKDDVPMTQRKEIIDKFFDKLINEKEMLKNKENHSSASNCLGNNHREDSIRNTKSSNPNLFQHRYRVQKNIIALQKHKLDQQNRLIEELKYNKIVDATKTSMNELKHEVTGLDNNVGSKMKPNVKLLTNELVIHEIQEPSLVLHCMKVPQFLQKMEQRARVREEKHALIRERRKQMEEEKVRMKQQAELEKLEMDRDERERRVAELREKRVKERMELIRKKQHEERMRCLTVMADLHYEKKISTRVFRPWIEMVKQRRENVDKAEKHYKFNLQKNVFLNWMWQVEDTAMERNHRADNLCRKKLMRKVMEALKKNCYQSVLKRQVAEDYYDYYLLKLIFTKWRENAVTEKIIYEAKKAKAIEHHKCNILFKAFTHWSSLPKLMCIQREREARKARWRHKVLQVVPDYTPQEDY